MGEVEEPPMVQTEKAEIYLLKEVKSRSILFIPSSCILEEFLKLTLTSVLRIVSEITE